MKLKLFFQSDFLLTRTFDTVCVKDLGQWSEMIISETLLTIFEAKIIFEAAGTEVKIGSNLKPKLNQLKLAKILKLTVVGGNKWKK